MVEFPPLFLAPALFLGGKLMTSGKDDNLLLMPSLIS